ncbi:MAG: hypothetical protein Fur0014_00820 [Rubrivivax sp.]
MSWAARLAVPEVAEGEGGHPALRLRAIAGNPAERSHAAMGARPLCEDRFDAHGTPVRAICCRIER